MADEIRVDNGDFSKLRADIGRVPAATGKTARQAVEVATELDLYTGGNVKEMTV